MKVEKKEVDGKICWIISQGKMKVRRS